MNINKYKFLLFSVYVGLFATTLSSCSESEKVQTGSLSIDPSFTTRGVETEVKSALIEIPVQCDGKWLAVVEDSCSWLSILHEGKHVHKGNGKIILKVDENRTQVGRKNTVTILDFNENAVEIPVYQTNTYYGEPLSNGTASWFTNNGIGCGANYKYFMQPDENRGGSGKTDFDPTKVPNGNAIFNVATLETKQTTGSVNDDFYVNAKIPLAQLDDKMLVNSITKSQHLDASIEMGCSFGFIEFEARGNYVSDLNNTSEQVNYSICREAPVLNSTLQVANIASYAAQSLNASLTDESLNDQEDDILEKYQNASKIRKRQYEKALKELRKPDFGGVFTKAFTDAYWDLYYAWYYQEELGASTSDSKIKAALGVLDNTWGPYFISGGQFGGSLNLYATVDKKNLDENTTFNAEVTGNISDAFNLSGAVAFTSAGKQLYEKSIVKMLIYGGDAANALNGISDFLEGSDMTSTIELQEILRVWSDSFADFTTQPDGSVEPTEAAPISFTITPIWTLFNEGELQNIVKDYFMEKYKDKGIENWDNIVKGESLGDVEDFLRKLAKKDSTTQD